MFVAAVRQAVIDGHADVAVHSLKDLPTAACEGIVVAAVPEQGGSQGCAVFSWRLPAELPPALRIGVDPLGVVRS